MAQPLSSPNMRPDLERLRAGTEEEKEAAAGNLMALGEPAVRGLQTILHQGDSDARWWAVRALAGIDSPAAAQLLVSALSDLDEDVRVCAVMGIGERQISDPSTLSRLVALLRNSSPYEKRHISDALGKIGETAIPDLLIALEDRSPAVRVQAARALVRIQSQSAIPALIKALDDPEAAVEHYAWEALQRMGVGVTLFFKP